MSCAACGRGFHEECLLSCATCHPEPEVTLPVAESTSEPKELKLKQKKELKDAQSTGRKRAARLYPIQKDEPCEWRGKKNCGGGKRPIIGCYDGLQEDRHHGPVKKTTRNEEGNVHRICKACHVHWHELNDLIYDEKDYNLLPHDPVAATDAEVMLNIVEWQSGEMKKKYELASSKNLEKFKERMKAHEDLDSYTDSLPSDSK